MYAAYIDLSEYLSRYFSPHVLNKIRNSHNPDTIGSFVQVEIENRDLTNHNLSNARFSDCKFKNVSFGALTKVEFARCEFIECRFNTPVNRAVPSIHNVVFYMCSFDKTNFSDCHLSDIQIAKSQFLTEPLFLASTIRGTLRIIDSGGWRTFIHLPDLNMLIDADTSLKTDLSVKNTLRVNWAHIRFLQQIPFLQVSLAGLTLLTAQLYWLSALVYIFRWPENVCGQLSQSLEKLLDKLTGPGQNNLKLCNLIQADNISLGIALSLAKL